MAHQSTTHLVSFRTIPWRMLNESLSGRWRADPPAKEGFYCWDPDGKPKQIHFRLLDCVSFHHDVHLRRWLGNSVRRRRPTLPINSKRLSKTSSLILNRFVCLFVFSKRLSFLLFVVWRRKLYSRNGSQLSSDAYKVSFFEEWWRIFFTTFPPLYSFAWPLGLTQS